MTQMNKPTNYTEHVRQLVSSGNFSELLNTYDVTKLPLFHETPPIVKSEPSTLEVMELAKTKSNNRKFGRQFAGQTPDWSQKNPTEERDVDSWAEARKRKSENRDWGLPEEHDMSDPASTDVNVAKPSRVQLEEEPYKPEVNYRGIIQNKIKPKPKTPKQMSYAELVAHRKENPESYPEIALEHLEKEGTGGHGVGDTAGAQVANGMAGLASGGTAFISTNAGIFTATHSGHRGKKIRRTSDGSHTVGEENYNTRGNYVPALTEYVKKQFLDKAKAPYYNRDVQTLDTSTSRDQKKQKRQSKQDNMAGHKRNSIWRNP
jgi:hypothetical protein